MGDPRLKFIKDLHNEATEKAPSSAYADIDRVRDILQELFYAEHTDWLIEQAEKVERYEEVLKEVADEFAFEDIYDEVNTKRFIAKQALSQK